MSEQPFRRPVCGMTLDEMRRALEKISGECRAMADELNGSDASTVKRLLQKIAQHAEEAHAYVMVLERRQTRERMI